MDGQTLNFKEAAAGDPASRSDTVDGHDERLAEPTCDPPSAVHGFHRRGLPVVLDASPNAPAGAMPEYSS